MQTNLKSKIQNLKLSARGRIKYDAPLAPLTWFRVGGPADILFKPADFEDLAGVLSQLPDDMPITVIGATSNLLIRDGGIRGMVIRLGRDFAKISVEGNHITAGAAALDLNVALTARDHSLAGLEFLSGIPGSIGGALRMNAGAYGTEIKDVLIGAEAIDRSGTLHKMTPEEMGLSYRHSDVPEDWIFTKAILQGTPGDHDDIAKKIEDIQTQRAETQPIRSRTGGSTFANPDGHKAWQLIDEAGCRGLIVGGAQMSEKHCNFMLNLGQATAADIEQLGETVRSRVLEHSGIELRWEIRRIGEHRGIA